ncbi:MAG: DICT sensory domain-containing protein [Anaerolineae bacterium]
MPIAIDPSFSVFHLTEKVQQGSTLLNHRRTMSLVSYEIENATLIDQARTRIFAGFQYFSKFMRQLSRYTNLALRAESVYVFGVPDVRPPALPNITYVPLQRTDHLAKEWFLVSYGRDYVSALATEELTRISDPDQERVFKGIWTFDHAMVSILQQWLTSTVDARALGFEETDLNYERQVLLMSRTLGRLTGRMERLQAKAASQPDRHPEELKIAINAGMSSAPPPKS